MDDEFEAEETEQEYLAFRVRPIDWLIVGVGFARQTTEAAFEALCVTQNLLRGQANFQVDQMVFQDEARREIETLTQED